MTHRTKQPPLLRLPPRARTLEALAARCCHLAAAAILSPPPYAAAATEALLQSPLLLLRLQVTSVAPPIIAGRSLLGAVVGTDSEAAVVRSCLRRAAELSATAKLPATPLYRRTRHLVRPPAAAVQAVAARFRQPLLLLQAAMTTTTTMIIMMTAMMASMMTMGRVLSATPL